jgi:general secretion pathway protein I
MIPRKERGFSLLEILVAFSILALSLGILMQIYSVSLRNVEVSGELGQAVTLAQSLLASAGIDGELAAGEISGEHAERFHWKLMVLRLDEENVSVDGSGAKPAGLLELWEVVAVVSWASGSVDGPPRSYTLTSLRVKPPKLP